MLPDQFTDMQVRRGALTSHYKYGWIHADQGYPYVDPPHADDQTIFLYRNGYNDSKASV